jgi:hypothetical protein
MTNRYFAGLMFLFCLVAACATNSGVAGELGNELTARTASSDGAPDVFYSNFFAAPYADQVSSVNIFYQGQAAANTFRFFQLRPIGPNQFNVVYDSGTIVPSGTLNTVSTLAFPNGPANVQPGDIFAHYGRGIPYSDAGGVNANQLKSIFYPSPAAPIVGSNITLPTAGVFPSSGFVRDYASSVTMSSFIEQVGFGTVNRANVDGATGVLGVLRNDPFTMEGTVTKWHIYNDNTPTVDRMITPLILRETAPGTYEVVGEGTPRTNNAAGLQMFDFDLVAGTADVLAGDMVGWWDGSGVTANLGVAEWDQFGTETIPLWADGNGVAIGDSYSAATAGYFGLFNRQYSINFTTAEVAAVPEPTTMAVWFIVGVAGAVVALRRRVARRA